MFNVHAIKFSFNVGSHKNADLDIFLLHDIYALYCYDWSHNLIVGAHFSLLQELI